MYSLLHPWSHSSTWFHSVPHRLLKQHPQQSERCASLTTSVNYVCCGRLDSPEEEVWSNNGNYSLHPALPVPYRILFKLCLFVYNSLLDSAQIYLSEHIMHHSVNQYQQHRWSAASVEGILHVAESKLVWYGNHSFGISGPTARNKLSSDIHDPCINLDDFCSRLETELFVRTYNLQRSMLSCWTWTQKKVHHKSLDIHTY